jgi:tRNA (guanine-N7-)-methyltransferase
VAKKKLKRFAENLTFPHLFQLTYDELSKGFHLKGKWHSQFFNNNHPITLELGCGKGEYTIFLAKKHPDRNYIGIDIKGARLWKGCRIAQDDGMKNVAFIRARIQLIEYYFGPGEIDQVWITFPDPHIKDSDEQKRLTSPYFLARYREIMQPDGIIHLKTDNGGLFNYTRKMAEREGHRLLVADDDIYHSGYEGDASAITTFYEEKFLAEGVTSKYIQFQLRHE